jgi:hypothetical protein
MDKDADKCDICRKPVVWPSHYGDWECPHCHQRYEYDEGLKITPTDAQWALLRNPPRWISVEEQWPAHGSDVLVAYKAGQYVLLGVGEFDGTTVNDDGVTVPYFKGIGGFEVTYWMPLPEPPEAAR